MNIEKTESTTVQVKFTVKIDGQELGRAHLLIGRNDLHKEPFGVLEDVFVEESVRKQGVGNALVEAVVQEARSRGCYKLIATSRFSRDTVHRWYERIGFVRHGFEFRMNLISDYEEGGR